MSKLHYLGSNEKIDLTDYTPPEKSFHRIEFSYGSVSKKEKMEVAQKVSGMIKDQSRMRVYSGNGEGIGDEGSFMNITLDLLPEESEKFLKYFYEISVQIK